jgi:hypothetical protein
VRQDHALRGRVRSAPVWWRLDAGSGDPGRGVNNVLVNYI